MTTRSWPATSYAIIRVEQASSWTWGWVEGKTASVLSAFEPRHLPALVVAPKRVCEHVWSPERDLWRPDLSLTVIAGDPARRARLLTERSDIMVISQDNLADVKRPYPTTVIDELSGYKDQSTNRWKLANRLSKDSRYVWGLTGTPSPNGLLDLWSQVFLLDRGERLGTRLTHYRDRYFRPGKRIATGHIVEWILRDESQVNIHRKLEDLCLSMEADEEHPVTYNTVVVDLPPSVRKHYLEFERELVLNLELLGGEVYSAANAAILTNKLAQVTAGFIYSNEGTGAYQTLHDEKIKALREIVDGTGSPIMVLYWYKPELAALRKAFPQAYELDDPDAITRWDRGEVPILLAHPASVGHGLNLQHGGHTAVWMTPTWNLELWLQTNKRLARPGQQFPVAIHIITARSTIDQKMTNRIVDKLTVQDALRDYLRSPI